MAGMFSQNDFLMHLKNGSLPEQINQCNSHSKIELRTKSIELQILTSLVGDGNSCIYSKNRRAQEWLYGILYVLAGQVCSLLQVSDCAYETVVKRYRPIFCPQQLFENRGYPTRFTIGVFILYFRSTMFPVGSFTRRANVGRSPSLPKSSCDTVAGSTPFRLRSR